MKTILFLGALGFLVTAYALTATGEARKTVKAAPKPKESNAIGNIIAKRIYDFVLNNLTDPQILIDELVLPTYLEDPAFTINGSVRLNDVEFAGHHGLNITTALGALLPLGGTFNFYLRDLNLTGLYHIEEEVITNLFPIPIYGDGPFWIDLKEVRLDTKVNLRIKLDGHLEITKLTYEFDIYEIEGRFEGLFSDVDPAGELNEAVNILFNSYATRLVNVIEANLHENITALAIDIGNQVLANLTLEDLIGGEF